MATPIYSSTRVFSHGETDAPVVLINEAPGPQEDAAGLPCFGAQGGELYRAFRRAGIPWASRGASFSWPNKPLDHLKADSPARQTAREEFLAERSRRVLVTNAYALWPRPADGKKDFCPPAPQDVLSADNVQRLAGELAGNHRVLLVGGYMAYLASLGETLNSPALREATPLTPHELLAANERLGTSFEAGWYMGHTRRWAGASTKVTQALQNIARAVGWL